jgi:phosphopantothenoylcysteine decarboxylase
MAVGILCECLKAGVPIVVAPNVRAVLAEHPAFGKTLRVLEGWGVHVMEQSPEPRGDRMASWAEILELASQLVQ